jgi:enoyl-CoA hydratase/carnithine racemase
MNEIEFSVEDGVAWIRLNRPAQKNAFTLDMIDAWAVRLKEADSNSAIGAIVVAGEGGNFCSGVDLAVMAEQHAKHSALEWKSLLWNRIHQIAFTMERLDKPVIACIEGVAVGAGLDMALMCDMRFASSSVRLSEGYIRIGAVPGDGGCYFLPRIVGTAKALELLLSGDFVDAEEAQRIGLVNRVFPDDVLREQTQRFAKRLVENSPLAVRMIKRAVYQSRDTDLRTALDLISSHMGVVLTTDDAAEAFAAFQERRKARFTGR